MHLSGERHWQSSVVVREKAQCAVHHATVYQRFQKKKSIIIVNIVERNILHDCNHDLIDILIFKR